MVAYRLSTLQRSYFIHYQRMCLRVNSMTTNTQSMYDESTPFGIQRLKSQIVKQISHEFRTPLTSILGFAEILEEDIRIDEKDRAEYAGYIRNEGLRLTKLIDDLIGLDSLEQGQDNLQVREYEAQETALYALMLVAESAHRKFIHVSIEFQNEPIVIKFDREKIVQVLYQLLHNAVRYTKPDGFINFKVEVSDKHVIFSIQDSGPGISARDIPYLFKRFGKLYRSSEDTQGCGVGLAIVKHIVDQHNGVIDVESQIGEGSTFTVRIPILS
jgi:signal transduction histidine kinase